VTSLCEKKEEDGGGGGILPRNSDGSVAWDRLASGEFLDALATRAGSGLQDAVDSGVPTQLSYGFVSGYCSGVALRRVGRALSVVFGAFVCARVCACVC
jgi:hypothetical protein